jgi:hypothetical protein
MIKVLFIMQVGSIIVVRCLRSNVALAQEQECILDDLWILFGIFPTLPYLSISAVLQVRLLLFRGYENANDLDYMIPFIGNLRRTLV